MGISYWYNPSLERCDGLQVQCISRAVRIALLYNCSVLETSMGLRS